MIILESVSSRLKSNSSRMFALNFFLHGNIIELNLTTMCLLHKLLAIHGILNSWLNTMMVFKVSKCAGLTHLSGIEFRMHASNKRRMSQIECLIKLEALSLFSFLNEFFGWQYCIFFYQLLFNVICKLVQIFKEISEVIFFKVVIF